MINLTFFQKEKFWSLIYKKGEDDCWPWTRSLRDGYGIIRFNSILYTATRIAYELTFGSFDTTLCVLHKCDNRRCCNPKHIFLGTREQNNKDRDTKGRHIPLKGIRHGNATITEDLVIKIRNLCKIINSREISRILNVNYHVVIQVKYGRTWRHI